MIGKISNFVRGGADSASAMDESKADEDPKPEPKVRTLPASAFDGQKKDRNFTHCFDENFDASTIKRTEMEPFVWVFENVLTSEECRKLIEFGENEGFEHLRAYPKDYRSNTRTIIRCQEAADILYKRLTPLLPEEYNKTYGNETHSWRRKSLNEVFRFCRYQKGQHFDAHCDADFRRSSNERSMFTFMLYLNGDLDGGATRFYKESEYRYEEKFKFILPPKEGSLLVFQHDKLHDGEQLHSGLKYIVRSDVMFERCSDDTE